MARGKGYFWAGLGEGVRGLYGQNVNERMAEEARAFNASQGGLDRAERARQFDKMFPSKSAEDDLTIPLQKTTQEELADAAAAHESAKKAFQANYDPDKKDFLMAEMARTGKRLEMAKQAHGTAQAGAFSKQGLVPPKPPPAPVSQKQKDLEDMRRLMRGGN